MKNLSLLLFAPFLVGVSLGGLIVHWRQNPSTITPVQISQKEGIIKDQDVPENADSIVTEQSDLEETSDSSELPEFSSSEIQEPQDNQNSRGNKEPQEDEPTLSPTNSESSVEIELLDVENNNSSPENLPLAETTKNSQKNPATYLQQATQINRRHKAVKKFLGKWKCDLERRSAPVGTLNLELNLSFDKTLNRYQGQINVSGDPADNYQNLSPFVLQMTGLIDRLISLPNEDNSFSIRINAEYFLRLTLKNHSTEYQAKLYRWKKKKRDFIMAGSCKLGMIN